MALTIHTFGAATWSPGGHPLEQKNLGGDDHVVMLQFKPGFRDPNWCERAHIIYVVAGELGLELKDGTQKRIMAGSACTIPHGTAHQAFCDGPDTAQLFVVSDLQLGADHAND